MTDIPGGSKRSTRALGWASLLITLPVLRLFPATTEYHLGGVVGRIAAGLLIILPLATGIVVLIGHGLRHLPPRARKLAETLVAGVLAAAASYSLKQWLFPLFSLKLVIGATVGAASIGAQRATGAVLAFAVLTALLGSVDIRRRLGKAASLFGLVILPLAFGNLALLAWNEAQARGHLAGAEAPRPPRGPRVIWVIFDEFDYDLAFSRSAAPRLPAFAQLRNRSLWATKAIAPEADTINSLPSLIHGTAAFRAIRRGPGRLDLEVSSSQRAIRFGEGDTIFAAAARDGRRVAIVGAYHPYCVIFAYVDRCSSWDSHYPSSDGYFASLRDLLAYLSAHYQKALSREPMPSGVRAIDRQTIGNEIAALPDFLADQKVDLLFVHLMLPHLPKAASEGGRTGQTDYDSNLVLADEQLRRLVEATVRSPRDSWLIVSSDHPFRFPMWSADLPRSSTPDAFPSAPPGYQPHVPFAVLHRGDLLPIQIDTPIATLSTRRLIEAILHGHVRSLTDASGFLARERRP